MPSGTPNTPGPTDADVASALFQTLNFPETPAEVVGLTEEEIRAVEKQLASHRESAALREDEARLAVDGFLLSGVLDNQEEFYTDVFGKRINVALRSERDREIEMLRRTIGSAAFYKLLES